MAVNVMSMRYPLLENSFITANEVTAISPAETRLSEKAMAISESAETEVKKANDIILEIERIDAEIRCLLSSHAAAVANLENASWSVVRSMFGYTNDEAREIVKMFSKKGFGPKQVRRAVQDIRAALFDDEDSKFREIVCIGVEFVDSFESARLMFKFEHTKTGNCFRIDIPTRRPCSSYNKCQEGVMVSGIGLAFAYNDFCTMTISYHYDIRVVREQLRLFVERGFMPLTEKYGQLPAALKA